MPDLPNKKAVAPRDRWFWSVLAVLVLGQLLAFWMLCSHQVRKAQMRDVSLQVQRVAVADCLQYIPRATLNSCVNRVDPYRPNALMAAGEKAAVAADAARPMMSSNAGVSVSYR